jgi:hypothetical protein
MENLGYILHCFGLEYSLLLLQACSLDLWLGIGQISAYGVQRETYNTSLHYFTVSMHIE